MTGNIRPDHYKIGENEDAIDIIAKLGWAEGFLLGNAFKYTVRWKQKGGVESLKKAQECIRRLVEIEESSEEIMLEAETEVGVPVVMLEPEAKGRVPVYVEYFPDPPSHVKQVHTKRLHKERDYDFGDDRENWYLNQVGG